MISISTVAGERPSGKKITAIHVDLDNGDGLSVREIEGEGVFLEWGNEDMEVLVKIAPALAREISQNMF